MHQAGLFHASREHITRSLRCAPWRCHNGYRVDQYGRNSQTDYCAYLYDKTIVPTYTTTALLRISEHCTDIEAKG